MGAYLQLVTPGIPLLGAWIYARPVRDPELQRRVHGRLHEHDPDRCLSRRRAPRGDLRDRADDGRARGRARHGQARAPAEELHQGVPAHAGLRADDRLRRLRRLARQAARGARPRRHPGRAGEAARERRRRSSSASGFSTYNEMCGLAPSRILGAIRYAAGGWEQATIRCLPTGSVQVITGTSPHGQSHETAWAQIVADQLGCDIDAVEVLHGDTSISLDRARHVRQPQPPGRRRRALATPARR